MYDLSVLPLKQAVELLANVAALNHRTVDLFLAFEIPLITCVVSEDVLCRLLRGLCRLQYKSSSDMHRPSLLLMIFVCVHRSVAITLVEYFCLFKLPLVCQSRRCAAFQSCICHSSII